ncbi:alpha/beta hydrolase [Trichocoleus sp. FACHB-591]|uniref:alpha/beta fold hydrolase n=1 Tax=Trichocoleus sp. FACHB-591 TaxID=2692872 RepID=UPI0016829149|nr:alpha/beta hydrolase [Trichocoleus sp. FACHB-591]MBD2097362.1 alpha/beta hydrolase [Trichocoleus sp. FACHB-591]
MLRHSITIDEHELSIFMLNEDQPGSPVVFLHGITLTSDFWLPNLPNTLKATPCYFINLPAHYPSRMLPRADTVQLTSEKLATLLQKAIQSLVGDRSVMLVGYSVGGFAALNLAAHYPSLVSRILCIAGFANGQWRGLMGVLQQLCCMGRPGVSFFKLVCRFSMLNPMFYSWVSGFFAGDRSTYFHSPNLKLTLAVVYPRVIHHNLDDLAYLFRSFASMDISSLLPHIQAPTLIMAGDRDPVIAYNQTQLLAEKIPNAELKVLSGMGHMFFAERFTEYQQILTSWVKQANITL